MAKREKTKLLIEIAETNEEADKVIVEAYGFKTIEEKIAFLKGMFDIEEVAHKHKDIATYYTMLHAVRILKNL